MIFVTGPLYAGKETYIRRALGWDEANFRARAVRDVQELVPCDDLAALADRLAARELSRPDASRVCWPHARTR